MLASCSLLSRARDEPDAKAITLLEWIRDNLRPDLGLGALAVPARLRTVADGAGVSSSRRDQYARREGRLRNRRSRAAELVSGG